MDRLTVDALRVSPLVEDVPDVPLDADLEARLEALGYRRLGVCETVVGDDTEEVMPADVQVAPGEADPVVDATYARGDAAQEEGEDVPLVAGGPVRQVQDPWMMLELVFVDAAGTGWVSLSRMPEGVLVEARTLAEDGTQARTVGLPGVVWKGFDGFSGAPVAWWGRWLNGLVGTSTDPLFTDAPGAGVHTQVRQDTSLEALLSAHTAFVAERLRAPAVQADDLGTFLVACRRSLHVSLAQGVVVEQRAWRLRVAIWLVTLLAVAVWLWGQPLGWSLVLFVSSGVVGSGLVRWTSGQGLGLGPLLAVLVAEGSRRQTGLGVEALVGVTGLGALRTVLTMWVSLGLMGRGGARLRARLDAPAPVPMPAMREAYRP